VALPKLSIGAPTMMAAGAQESGSTCVLGRDCPDLTITHAMINEILLKALQMVDTIPKVKHCCILFL
jgi:hypothetical protein